MKNWKMGLGVLVVAGLALTAIFVNMGSNQNTDNKSTAAPAGQNEAKNGQANPSQTAEAPRPGYKAPNFTLKDMDGKTVKLSDFQGKPVLLNFWASWCPPCNAEMPDLVKKSEQYKDKVVFLGINLTATEQDSEGPKNFVKKYNVQFPTLMDEKGKIADLYQALGIPTTFTVDPNGVIVDAHQGMLDEKGMESTIQKLLKK